MLMNPENNTALRFTDAEGQVSIITINTNLTAVALHDLLVGMHN